LSSNRWSLPAKDADETFVSAPQDFSGTMEAIVRLYSPGNESLQTAKIRLEWARSPVIKATDAASPAPAPQAFMPTKSEPPPVIADPNQPTTGQVDSRPVSQTNPSQSEEAQASNRPRPAQDSDALLQVGERMLREGDIAAARVALRRAAEAGSAEAARDLGMSFDPSFLRRIGAAAAPDLAQAAEWYGTAKRLGLKDTSQDRDRLAKMPDAEATITWTGKKGM
jgi:hypothetical protein